MNPAVALFDPEPPTTSARQAVASEKKSHPCRTVGTIGSSAAHQASGADTGSVGLRASTRHQVSTARSTRVSSATLIGWAGGGRPLPLRCPPNSQQTSSTLLCRPVQGEERRTPKQSRSYVLTESHPGAGEKSFLPIPTSYRAHPNSGPKLDGARCRQRECLATRSGSGLHQVISIAGAG